MKIEFKTKKSAGIPVTRKVHGLIARGNAARGNDWQAAADAYAAAMTLDPSLYHIQVQLGHAAKEAGRLDQSEAAYRAAAGLRNDTGEPFLHLGHLAKRFGARTQSLYHYAVAARYEDTGDDALREVRELVVKVAPLDDVMLRRMLTEPEPAGVPAGGTDLATPPRAGTAFDRRLDALPAGTERETVDRACSHLAVGNGLDTTWPSVPVERPLVFDLTDLVAHFRDRRLPSGIQRVQIEVLANAIRTQGRDNVQICCFTDGRDHWIGIPIDRFLRLAHLASSGSDAFEEAWVDARARLFFGLAVEPDFTMPRRAVLVNLGTSWWVYDYFRLIREAKQQADISYVPFVHDWIPVMAPGHVVRGVTEDFINWTVGVFAHADAFLVNSLSTRTDLLRVANRLGYEVDEQLIEVVPLNADFRAPSAVLLPETSLGRWGLRNESYALFVSTIESRKNHVLAFEAWAELIRRHGADEVPQLVCVGRDGWLNDRAFARLKADPDLAAAVTIIHEVSDEELALLYSRCQFTIYPSHYEGWGLPVTESLCYGRVPIVADNSSLFEAGAGFAVMFDTNSLPSFVRAVEAIAFDRPARRAREKAIVEGFRPRSWTRIAAQINAAVMRFTIDLADRPATVPRPVGLGDYVPLALYKEARLWRGLASGEIFRSGDGWLWPEMTGCRTRPDGGELRMTIQGARPEQRLYVHLRGLAKAYCGFRITANGSPVIEGTLKPEEERWASGDLPRDTGAEVSILVRGDVEETIILSTGGNKKRFQAGPTVIGFGLCDSTDAEQRARFVAAAAFGDLGSISAYRYNRVLVEA